MRTPEECADGEEEHTTTTHKTKHTAPNMNHITATNLTWPTSQSGTADQASTITSQQHNDTYACNDS